MISSVRRAFLKIAMNIKKRIWFTGRRIIWSPVSLFYLPKSQKGLKKLVPMNERALKMMLVSLVRIQ